MSTVEMEECLGITESDKVECPHGDDCANCPLGYDADTCAEMYDEWLLEQLGNVGED